MLSFFNSRVLKRTILRIFQKLLLVLAGLLIACLVAEGLLRLFDYQGLSLMEKDPVLGQKYKANKLLSVYEAESARFVDIHTNSLGFRDLEHAKGKSSKKRVVILGDSFVAGFSVDFKDNLSQVCERYLNEHSQHEWEVINLGVAGFGTAQEMIAYREYGRLFHPDYVVLAFFSGNDVSDNSSELSTNPRIYFTLDRNGNLVQEPYNQLRSRASSFLNDHSRFYLWQKTQFKKLATLYKYKVQLSPTHRVFLTTYDAKTDRAWNITYALMQKLKLLVNQDGAEFGLLNIPYSDEVNEDWWSETLRSSPPMQKEMWDLQKPERLLSRFCETRSIPYLSPRSLMLQQTQAKNTPFYFKHGHLSETGHKLMGDLIAQWILGHQDAASPVATSYGGGSPNSSAK